MTAQTRIDVIANRAAEHADTRPFASVLIPFLRDDPSTLVRDLAVQAERAEMDIVLIDDGAPDSALTARVAEAVGACPGPARLLVSRRNLGRSGARNALADHARGDWLLFLDADMQIGPTFLHAWREALKADPFDLAFGGYEPPLEIAAEHRVHAALAHAGDVENAEARATRGAAAFCGSNFAVRASLMAKVRFDEGYVGWGWEDVDWAARAEKVGRLAHIDHPARHGGLQSVKALAGKFTTGGVNHARLLMLQPEQANRPAARLARLLKTLRIAIPARAFGLWLACGEVHPVRARVFGLKLVRAAACAEHMP